MKTKLLGLLAVGLLAGPMVANAVVVTISGTASSNGQWDITTQSGSFNALSSTLQSQEWWNDRTLAGTFALALDGSLGYPNVTPNFDVGPLFAWGQFEPTHFRARTCYDVIACSQFVGELVSGSLSSVWVWGTATRVSTNVPEPGTLALLGLGLAGLGLSRRRKAN